ncbi:class I SAM-dependent methyltransferase [archaeon]|nr:MAG: class I SAM-dependent methyltransferase [archaeon]
MAAKVGHMPADEAMRGIERRFMYSPLKHLMQRAYEVPSLLRLARRHGVTISSGRVLDAGCGAGFGLETIAHTLHPAELHGCDIDPSAVQRARTRVPEAIVSLEDVTSMNYPPDTFDAIFMFGVLHHVPRWQQAVSELERILTPGGTLLLDDHPKRSVDLMERILRIPHPLESRFRWEELTNAIGDAGLSVVASELHLAGHFGYVVCTKPDHGSVSSTP